MYHDRGGEKAESDGEKIMLATDSSTFAEDVTATLENAFSWKKFLCVNQKSKQDEEVDAFTNQPKVMVMKYDGPIHSPSISSGVSFEKKHFDRHFGMCGESRAQRRSANANARDGHKRIYYRL
ncbi:hypothetical protein [Escherichia coli]|uniref:hypothetical protein n=1 Tax=Escherichia coli TaxID=562 RepID=UPI0035155BD8